MKNKKVPKMLFKYKSVNTPNDLIYLLDIIDNKRLYMPKYYDFNDPLEGNMYDFIIDDQLRYAGISIIEAVEKEYNFVDYEKEMVRILSMSDRCDSPLMWAHYANEHKGVCLCYDYKVFKSKAFKIDYLKDRVVKECNTMDDIDKYAKESLLYKFYDWSYEREWRVLRDISNGKDDPYFSTKEGLKAVIFGYKMDPIISEFLSSHLPPKIKKYKTYIATKSNNVKILPFNYELIHDGSNPPFIEDIVNNYD